MAETDYSKIAKDKLLCERSRLLILSYLAASETESATFMELQKIIEISRGNLSIQIGKLQDAEYVKTRKKFKDKKSQTTIHLALKGRLALMRYLEDINKLMRIFNNSRSKE